MNKSRRKGFTLVEILIVVVILGILAAIVVPQFTSASTEAIKSSIQSQLQTISSQVELFRVRNQGAFPDFTKEADNGWEDLTTEEYLKDEPFNGYTGETAIVAGTAADSAALTRDAESGWAYDADDGFSVSAAGYDPETGLLQHEAPEEEEEEG